MTKPVQSIERYLRMSRRGMMLLFSMILVVGGACLALALRPDSAVARWFGFAPWLVGVLFAAVAVGLQRWTFGSERWNPAAPEALSVLEDEWRKTNLNRARHVAFVVVLLLQLPVGLLVSRLPSLRAVMAMATSTITVGMATLVGLFLYFDREEANGQ